MEQLPKISVITPTLNQGRFIERTIRSIHGQGYPNLEHIVMDGGSTDGTLDILKQYEDRLQWFSEKDAGQADAINRGIERSSGEIITYLNSDDVYEAGALQRVARFFTGHRDAKWLTGKCRILDEQDAEVRRSITAYKNLLLRHFSYSLLLITNPISQPSTFWRREVVDNIGLLNTNEHYVMDYEYWLRIGRKYPLSVLDEYLAGFRVYSDSKTSSSFLMSFRQELDVAKKYSSSRGLLALHRLSYLGISAVYLILNSIDRTKRQR